MPGYINLIAGVLTDLNPGAHAYATVRYHSTPSRFMVRWYKMALYASEYDVFTFTITIEAGGQVRVYIESMVPVEEVNDVETSTGEGSVVRPLMVH